jgi:hypothetical protein
VTSCRTRYLSRSALTWTVSDCSSARLLVAARRRARVGRVLRGACAVRVRRSGGWPALVCCASLLAFAVLLCLTCAAVKAVRFARFRSLVRLQHTYASR